MTFNDILTGNGPEYILLTKKNGKYVIFTTGKNIKDIQKTVNDLISKVEEQDKK